MGTRNLVPMLLSIRFINWTLSPLKNANSTYISIIIQYYPQLSSETAVCVVL